MPAVLQRHPLLAVLGVVAALLAAVIGVELALGTPSARPAAAAKRPAPSESKLLPAVAPTAPEAYPETVARPLFIATRRPAPEAPSVPQATMVKGQFILQGVTIHGDTRIAFLREKSSGRTHRVERGKDVNGVTLASVDADRVVLAQGADREELVLSVQKGVPLPAQPPAPGPPFVPPPAAGAPAVPNPISTLLGAQPVVGAGPFLPPGFDRAAALPAPPAPAAAPAQPSEATLTPEEVLARRRARRVAPAAGQ